MEMLLGGIKSHKPLHQLLQEQFIKMSDHSCLMVHQRAKAVVLLAEMKSITAMQRRFQPLFQTCCTPLRNTILHLFKKFEEEGMCGGREASVHSECEVSSSCESTLCGNPAQP